MNPDLPVYTPQEVEAFTRVSGDMQRDWRRRGFLSEYGQQSDKGRWKYSLKDVVAFSLAGRLGLMGADLEYATLLARQWAPALLEWLQGRPAAFRFMAKAMSVGQVAFYEFADGEIRAEDGEAGLGANGELHANTLSEWDNLEFERLEVLDLKYIAATTRKALRDEAQKYVSD